MNLMFFSSLFYLSDEQICFNNLTLLNTNIPKLISEIFSEESAKDYAYKFSIRIKISEIFLDIIRLKNIEAKSSYSRESEYRMPAMVPLEVKTRFHEIFNYIDDHFSEDITAKQIMEIARMSHTSFASNLKILTGKSFKEYLNHVRISKSKKLLATTQKNNCTNCTRMRVL